MNQPDNGTGNNNTDDNAGNNTQNTQPDNTGNSSPVTIDGTWEIVSGYGVVSYDLSGHTQVLHYTYTTGTNSNVSIEMTKNDSRYGDYYKDLFTLTLTGDDVMNSGVGSSCSLMVYCTLDEDPNQKRMLTFSGLMAYKYLGDGTYQMTDDTADFGMGNYGGSYKYTLTLNNASALRWTVWTKTDEKTLASSNELWQEILLRVLNS